MPGAREGVRKLAEKYTLIPATYRPVELREKTIANLEIQLTGVFH